MSVAPGKVAFPAGIQTKRNGQPARLQLKTGIPHHSKVADISKLARCQALILPLGAPMFLCQKRCDGLFSLFSWLNCCFGGTGRDTTIYEKRLTSYVTAGFRGKKHHSTVEVVWPPGPLHRYAIREVLRP